MLQNAHLAHSLPPPGLPSTVTFRKNGAFPLFTALNFFLALRPSNMYILFIILSLSVQSEQFLAQDFT